MRTIVDLPEKQVRGLDRLCDDQGISRAEAVRRAVADLLARRTGRGRTLRGFGVWKDRSLDGVSYQRRLRAEWSPRDRCTGHQHHY
jgi:Arc/MetJ-type ribon-helix-helix transcriptional regulator